MQTLATILVDRRRLLLVGVCGLTLFAIGGAAQLQFDDEPRAIFRGDDPSFALLEEVFTDFGADENDCILVVQGDLFTPEGVAAFRDAVARLRATFPDAVVQSLADAVVFDDDGTPHALLPTDTDDRAALAAARQAALKHPLIAGQLLSDDASTALILLRLGSGSFEIRELSPIVAQARAIVRSCLVDSGLTVQLTGIPAVRVDIFQTIGREQSIFLLLGGLFGFTVSALIYRRWAAVIIVAIPPMVGVLWTLGTLGWLGAKLNIINTVLPTLILVIGFTDTMHLMYDLRRSRLAGRQVREATQLALRHLMLPCAITSLTTAIGFASLATARVTLIRAFGLECALGSLFTFLAVITVFPLLANTPLGAHVEPRAARSVRRSRFFGHLATATTRFAAPLSIGAVALSLWFAYKATQLVPDNSIHEALPSGRESSVALQHLDDVFDGMLLAYVLVEWEAPLDVESRAVLEVLEQATELLDREPLVARPVSVLNLLDTMPAAVGDRSARAALLPFVPADIRAALYRSDRRRALITAHIRDSGTRIFEPVVDRLERNLAGLAAQHPGFRLRLTGTMHIAVRNGNGMIADLAQSLMIAGLVVFIIVTATLRSVPLGLISIIPNAFPLVATASLLVLTDHALQVSSVIVFTICLGIAVDDTIHFLVRYQRERADGNDRVVAVRHSLQAVGPVLVATTTVLIAGFGTVLLTEMEGVFVFAVCSMLALATALVGDLLFLPALLAWHPLGNRRSGT